MTTNDIIRALARRLNISQAQARQLLRQKLLQLRRQLQEQERVDLPGLGTLQVKVRQARRGFVPGRDAFCHIPERRRVVFKAQAALARTLRKREAS